MKKCPLKSSFLLACLVLTGTTTAFARQETERPSVICRTQQNIHFNAETYEFFNQQHPDEYVKITSMDGTIERLPSKSRMASWVIYVSEFSRGGETVILQYSNYLSPSMGVLYSSSMGKQDLACQLTFARTP